jgi:hypothetical protein
MAVVLANSQGLQSEAMGEDWHLQFDVSSGHPLGWLMSLVCHRLPHSVPHERGGVAHGDRVGKRGDRMGTDWGPEWRTRRVLPVHSGRVHLKVQNVQRQVWAAADDAAGAFLVNWVARWVAGPGRVARPTACGQRSRCSEGRLHQGQQRPAAKPRCLHGATDIALFPKAVAALGCLTCGNTAPLSAGESAASMTGTGTSCRTSRSTGDPRR